MLVGLDSQRLAGKLTHLQLEINPLYLEPPVPVRFFPGVSLLRSIRISKKFILLYLQWNPKLISSFKELVDNSVCVSQQDIYRKAKGNNGAVPKTYSICPML